MTVTEHWLRSRYVDDLASVEEIAADAGCSTANIRRYLKKWGIRRGKSFIKGKPAWNSGLTKADDERLAKLSEQRTGEGNPMFGKSAWNAGLSKEVDDRLALIAVKNAGKSPSEEVRAKMRDAKLGKSGQASNAWKGGTQYSNGYGVKRISVSGRRIYEHRWVAEQCLGRELRSDEHVHHLDRNKHNNAPENLIVLSEDDHTRLHQAISNTGVSSRPQQLQWLRQNSIHFEELFYEDHQRDAA